jgi:hypothetical protein
MIFSSFISRVSVNLYREEIYITSGDIYRTESFSIHTVMPIDRYLFSWNPYSSGNYSLGFLASDRSGGDIYSIESNEWISSFLLFQLDSFANFSMEPILLEGEYLYNIMRSSEDSTIEITLPSFWGDNYIVTFYKDRSGNFSDRSKRYTEISFRSLDLNVIWTNSDYKSASYGSSGDQRFSGVYDFNNFICIDNHSVIFALDKSDGKEVWRFAPEGARSFDAYNLVSDDLILFVAMKTIYLLNPENGAVLNQIDFSEKYNYLRAEYDGEYIYIFINDSPQILVYDKTGSTLINRIDIPEPYQFMGLEVPHLVDGVLYASLNCATRTYNALMTLTKDELLGKALLTIGYEARPDTQIDCIKNPDDSDHYVVTVIGDKPDWVFRYAGVAAMDVVAKHGTAPVPSPDLNQDFNGLIKIRVGGLPDEKRTDEFLERLAFQVCKSAKDQHHRAGIHKIRAECEWV